MTHDYAHTYYYVKSRRSNKRTFFYFIIIFFAILGLTTVIIDMRNKDNKTVAGASVQTIIPSPTLELNEKSGLRQVVEHALEGTKGNYGIAIYNLKTSEFYTQNEHKTFLSASLYKLWVMAAIFDLINKDKIKDTDKMHADIDKLYERFNLASPSANSDINITVKDAMEKMITVSDNTAALLLTSKAKLANLRNFLNLNNFTDSKLGMNDKNPVTTPYDIAIFFKRLYYGELLDKKSSDMMLEILKRQKLNDKIPKYLPSSTIIAHKTGELNEFNHDAGIVYTPQGDYIIVVMSESDVNSRLLAEERISVLSKDVYNYFANNQ